MLIFITKRFALMIMTMVVVSILLFLVLEISPGSVATKVLGQFATEEQKNIWLEEHDGRQVAEYRDIEPPELDDDGTFELLARRWRFSHSYRAIDQRTARYTVYRAARPADWVAR